MFNKKYTPTVIGTFIQNKKLSNTTEKISKDTVSTPRSFSKDDTTFEACISFIGRKSRPLFYCRVPLSFRIFPYFKFPDVFLSWNAYERYCSDNNAIHVDIEPTFWLLQGMLWIVVRTQDPSRCAQWNGMGLCRMNRFRYPYFETRQCHVCPVMKEFPLNPTCNRIKRFIDCDYRGIPTTRNFCRLWNSVAPAKNRVKIWQTQILNIDPSRPQGQWCKWSLINT